MSVPRKAVVIGAGIIGASIALELARRGYHVHVLEKNKKAGQGSTALSSSVIRCHYTRPEAVAIALEGRHIWETWAAYTGLSSPRARYHPVGVLFLLNEGEDQPAPAGLGVKAEMDRRGIDHRLRMMMEAGVEVQLLRSEALARTFPFFRFTEPSTVGLYEPRSGYVAYPVEAVEDLREAGEKIGVTYRFQTHVERAVTEWVGGGRVIRALCARASGKRVELECGGVVNCAGPDSHGVNIDLGCPLPSTTAPLRQCIVGGTWTNSLSEPIPAMADLVGGFYIRPDVRVFKIGAVLPQDHVDFVRTSDGAGDPDRVKRFEMEFLRRLSRRAPGIQLSDVHTRVAYYDWTVSDSYPILDATDLKGYYVAIGTSGAWFKGGPVIGHLMAELIARRDAGERSTRVTLSRTGNVVDMKLFSARRPL